MLKEKFEICSSDICTGCGACMQVCPHGCISMIDNEEGFKYPQIDFEKCLFCKRCVKTCPENSLVGKLNAKFFMAWHYSEKVLLNSSSGGVFTALADYVFQRGGIVYGVNHDATQIYAWHEGIENKDDLDRLRKSKYYQSDTLQVYQEIKYWLQQKRWVLFTGTSCQVAGLLNLLGNISRETLLTMDILCHGVTSHKVVRSFIRDREKEYGKKVLDFGFRIKVPRDGWLRSTKTWLRFVDGNLLIPNYLNDFFFPAFNRNLFLRESCYRCRYCGCQRISDFTAADFWGVNKESIPFKQLYNGVSLLLVNTAKGAKIQDILQKDLYMESIDISHFISHTSLALTRPCERPHERDSVFSLLEQGGYDHMLRTLMPYYFRQVRRKKIFTKILGERGYEYLKSLLHR